MGLLPYAPPWGPFRLGISHSARVCLKGDTAMPERCLSRFPRCFLIDVDGRLYRRRVGPVSSTWLTVPGPGHEWLLCAAPEGLTMPEWIEILREVEIDFPAVPILLDRELYGEQWMYSGSPPECATALATRAATGAREILSEGVKLGADP